jgi:FAD dependent monooxygenase
MAYGRLKVVIVGGSVAGLTLAHTLASAGIDFVLLEARDNIAPPLGATIILMPNGARVLDQLGVFKSMESFLSEETVHITRKSDGTLMGRNDWPTVIKERLVGDRQQQINSRTIVLLMHN